MLARCLHETNDLETAQRYAASVKHEIEALLKTQAPELPSVYPKYCGQGQLVRGDGRFNVTVVVREFVQGMPIDVRLSGLGGGPHVHLKLIVATLEAVARALVALHGTGVGHFDVRAANVIHPDQQGRPAMLVDLDASQLLQFGNYSRHTILRIDPRSAPKEWIAENADARGNIDLAKLGGPSLEWLDWYQFGLLIRELLASATLEPTNASYLSEVAAFLTDYPVCIAIRPVVVHRLLQKAKPEFLHPYGVAELTRSVEGADTDFFPDGRTFGRVGVLGRIAKHPAFTRLYKVKQLTLVKYIFTGAEHTRAMHMAHSTAVATELIEHLFSEPRFRRIFDSSDVTFALVAALLHDINHFPFLHTFQESAGSEFTNRILFDEVMDSDFAHYATSPHEPLREVLANAGIDTGRLWRVIFGRRQEQSTTSPVEQFVNSMLDSEVDVDKLSYLALDAHFTGVPQGSAIDVSRLMRSALVAQDAYRMECLAFDVRGLAAAESVVTARLANFRSVYWHPRNRSLMAMFLYVADAIDFSSMDMATLRRQFLVSSEEEVIQRMNELYVRRTGKASPMGNFVALRGAGLYEEVYEVPLQLEGPNKDIYNWLQSLSRANGTNVHEQRQVRVALAEALTTRFLGSLGPVDESEVLLDIPSRPMSSRVAVQIRDDQGVLYDIATLSRSARAAFDDFEMLAQRIRIFAAPRVAAAMRATDGRRNREWMSGLLLELTRSVRPQGAGRLS